jgi:RNA polymerase sigma-70 factor (ECF subfamily)
MAEPDLPSDVDSAAAARADVPHESNCAHVEDFEEFFRQRSSFVWRVLRRLGVESSDVEDVVQEVFFAAHQAFGNFEGRSSLSTWLYAICIRTASNYRRRAYRRREVSGWDAIEVQVPARQEESLERQRAVELLDRILDELDDKKRDVFVLFELEQLSMNDVARAVGCDVKTAYSRLYAARAQVQAAVRRQKLRRHP